jgi:hypothetical protein
MVIGKKFWPLEIGDYRPSQNPPISFRGDLVIGNNTIINADPAAVTAINTLLPTVAVVGGGVSSENTIASAAGTTITFNAAAPFPLTYNAPGANFIYYDKSRPCAGQDQPINAIVCIDGTDTALEFYDTAGTLISIPDGVLVPGAVYYFQINVIKNVVPGTFIGYAPN